MDDRGAAGADSAIESKSDDFDKYGFFKAEQSNFDLISSSWNNLNDEFAQIGKEFAWQSELNATIYDDGADDHFEQSEMNYHSSRSETARKVTA